MKRIACLALVLFLCISILTNIGFAAASEMEINSVGYDATNGTVTVTGTADCQQVIVQLWDVNNNIMISFISVSVSDNEFSAIIRTNGLQDGGYKIKAADYTGGSYTTSSFAVPYESMPTPTPTPTPTPMPTPTPTPTSSSGSSGGASPVVTNPPPITDNKIETPSTAGFDGAAVAKIDNESIKQAIKNATQDESGVKNIEITIKPSSGATAYNTQLPSDMLTSVQTGTNIKIITPIATFTIPDSMFKTSDLAGAQNVSLNVSNVDKAALPAEVAGIIGSRPVINLSANVDGKVMEWNNSDAPVTVSIPYSPTADELADIEHIVVWYIDGSGNPFSVPSGRYDPVTGTVTFTTTHFSRYSVAYIKKTFTDLSGFEWVAKPVDILASKGIIEGSSETAFAPGRNITRGEFIMWVVKSMSLNAKFDSNFPDVNRENKYYETLGIARKLGIALGKGDEKYYPEEKISRQDMMVLTGRALKAVKLKLASGTIADVNKFNDAAKVAEYAMNDVATVVRTGIIVGSSGYLNPAGTATRAEAAMIIHRIYYLKD